MWKSMWKGLGMLSLYVVVGAGCVAGESEADSTAEPQGDICTQAATHVSTCLGEQIAPDPSCNPQDAQALIGQSCDDLRRQTAGGKADLMCNPIFFWTDCNRGIKINTTTCGSETTCDWSDGVFINDHCFNFQIKDSQGNVVVEEMATGSDYLMTEDLDDGDYTIEILNRDGSIVPFLENPGTLTGWDYSNDMDGNFTVTNGRSDSHTLYLPILNDEAENYHQCGSLYGNVQLTCEGEVYQDPAAVWDWYVTVTPTSGTWSNGDDDTRLITLSGGSRAAQAYEETMDLNVFRKQFHVWYELLPGTYDLDFYYFIHDGSEFNIYSDPYFDREDFEKFIRKSGYMSGYKETRTIELTAEDFTTQFARHQQAFEISYPGACPR